MRILLWHGYLLTGSGSNVYSANVARAWRGLGHDVLVLCQEGAAEGLPFVDEVGTFDPQNETWQARSTGASPASGRCTVVRPNIGGLLPVYVYDAYPGFEVKLFTDLTQDELDAYVARNVTALVSAIRQWRPDVVMTGHEVMGPEIARLATDVTGSSYIAQLHGSGLEYAVKRQERYRAYAASGLAAAHRVVGGSRYMVGEASRVIPGDWHAHAVVVNPGCDVELFEPRPRPRRDMPIVGYVGKLIVAKGVHDIIGALGLCSQPFETVIVGYGGFESELHNLVSALGREDVEGARAALATEQDQGLAHLARLLADPPDGWVERSAARAITFTGRLEHGPLSQRLPTFDVLVVPSIVPEAFGMVAAEAAASGVLPIVPSHSGISEAGAAIEETIGAPGLLTYDAADPIRGIAAAIDRVLMLEPEGRHEMEQRAVALARERWAWPRVAQLLVDAAE